MKTILLLLLLAAPLEAADPPPLTETDQLRIQVVNLMAQLASAQKEADLCRAQLAEPRATANQKAIDEALVKAKAAIAAAHPGYELDPATGTLVPLTADRK